VSKEEYDSCRINQANPRVIAVCNKPHELMYFTITFRSFTPTPGGMEFTPGRDYYFISTSSSYDLYQRVGGRCSTHHMKVAFKVADNVQHQPQVTTPRAVNAPRNRHHLQPPAAFPIPGPAASEVNHYPKKELSYMYTTKSAAGGSKRTEEFDRHPNDVVKHEASRLAAASKADSKTSINSLVSVMICAIVILEVIHSRHL
jgi:ephrin-B